jgi:hypothetical protein
MNIRFLTALNVAMDDDELLDYIDFLATEIESGHLAATVDGDAITSLRLTALGKTYLRPTRRAPEDKCSKHKYRAFIPLH